MAWKWPSLSNNGASEEWTGFIDQGVTLEGTLQVTGTFRIDGNVKGNIISEQTVVLGDGAKVEGQIEGNRVVISGRFDGVIFAKGRVLGCSVRSDDSDSSRKPSLKQQPNSERDKN